jgi:hypothetical protein
MLSDVYGHLEVYIIRLRIILIIVIDADPKISAMRVKKETSMWDRKSLLFKPENTITSLRKLFSRFEVENVQRDY